MLGSPVGLPEVSASVAHVDGSVVPCQALADDGARNWSRGLAADAGSLGHCLLLFRARPIDFGR